MFGSVRALRQTGRRRRDSARIRPFPSAPTAQKRRSLGPAPSKRPTMWLAPQSQSPQSPQSHLISPSGTSISSPPQSPLAPQSPPPNHCGWHLNLPRRHLNPPQSAQAPNHVVGAPQSNPSGWAPQSLPLKSLNHPSQSNQSSIQGLLRSGVGPLAQTPAPSR